MSELHDDPSSEPESKRKRSEGQWRPMDLAGIGRLLLFIGAGVAAFGGLLLILSRIPVLNQLFNLSGDIRIETSNVSCFFPIVTMIILSVLLTVIANIVIRLLNR